MNEETCNKLLNILTSANGDLLEMIAVVDALIDIMEIANDDVALLCLIQKSVKKIFNNNCVCKNTLSNW